MQIASARLGGRGRALLAALVAGTWLLVAGSASAQDNQAADGMIVRRVEIVGLETISEGWFRRSIKTRESQPFSRRQVEEDVRALLRSRRFLNAFADTKVEENQVVVTFTVQERPTIATVEIEGNKVFTDDKLYEVTPAAGDALDVYDVRRGRDEIERRYKEAGYYYVEVTVNEQALLSEGRVVYQIVEGPRVRVRKILLEGNRSFPNWRLRPSIRSKTYFWLFRTGAFDEEIAGRDAVEIQRFYHDEGYLDARVGYRLDFDEVSRSDLRLVFVIEEGVRYTIQDIAIDGNTAYDTGRLRAAMQLEPGFTLRNESLREDVRRVQELYGEIGYVDAYVDAQHEFLEQPGVVRLHYQIDENKQYRIGRISIRGNQRTRDEVVRRELKLLPGDLFNMVAAKEAEQRLKETGLFAEATITPLPPAGDLREALVEVEETETVTFLIGVGVSTDSGVLGSLSIENRNFDLFDWPRTWGQFFRGQAFRGDGQRLRFSAEPGTEMTRFRIDFTEPYLLDRPLRLDTSAYLFQRGRDAYDEQRLGVLIALSKRFERGFFADWAVEGALRAEQVSVSDVDPLAPSDVREVRGDHFLSAFKVSVVRDTTDSRMVPTRGYRFNLSWEQVGALGGDFQFGRPSAGFAWYKTLRTDIFDRKSVFAVRADASYIVGDAPVFERFYGGGFGSIRGFHFRGISPRKGVKNTRVGGDLILLTGAEYSFPLYGKSFRGVTFLDMGTVEEGLTITDWRASVGFGLRINVDFFGPVPIVLDFGFPIAKGDDDDTQVFNFSFGASF
ncbi:MAG: outer membrane protein assembly factor BamA [Phycisphaerae bacterium]